MDAPPPKVSSSQGNRLGPEQPTFSDLDQGIDLLKASLKVSKYLEQGSRLKNLAWRLSSKMSKAQLHLHDIEYRLDLTHGPSGARQSIDERLAQEAASLAAGYHILTQTAPVAHPLAGYDSSTCTAIATFTRPKPLLNASLQPHQSIHMQAWEHTLGSTDPMLHEDGKARLRELAKKVLEHFEPEQQAFADGMKANSPNPGGDTPASKRQRFGIKKGRNPSASAAPASSNGISRQTTSTHVEGEEQVCSNCQTRHTPLWRRSATDALLCNACALYERSKGRSRPVPAKTGEDGTPVPEISCSNCATTKTPMWRRSEKGEVLCNACQLYSKLHGRPRPLNLPKRTPGKRKKVIESEEEPEFEAKQGLKVPSTPSDVDDFSPLTPVHRPPTTYSTPTSQPAAIRPIWGNPTLASLTAPTANRLLPTPFHSRPATPSERSIMTHYAANSPPVAKRARFDGPLEQSEPPGRHDYLSSLYALALAQQSASQQQQPNPARDRNGSPSQFHPYQAPPLSSLR